MVSWQSRIRDSGFELSLDWRNIAVALIDPADRSGKRLLFLLRASVSQLKGTFDDALLQSLHSDERRVNGRAFQAAERAL